jgi:CheY-like chemotaxis protein
MRIVFAGGSGGLSGSRLAKALADRGHGVVGATGVEAVLDLPADWLVLDARSALNGALELALQAPRSAQVAVMTEEGLRCARTWDLFPPGSSECARELEALAARRDAPVLIVEDDEDTRRSVVEVIDGEGLATAEARDGEEAVRHVIEGPRPCLVLLDVMMPKLDGLGVLRVLRSQADLASIPVLFATSVDDDRLPRDVPRLSKPLGVGPLVAAVHRYRRRAA